MEKNTILHIKPFYMMRHGETDWNKERKVMGQSDIPLNKNGILQAQIMAEKIQSLPIEVIVTSSLQRAKGTSEIVAKKINKPIIVEPNLRECYWGIMEGKVKGNCSYENIPFEPEKWWQQDIVPKDAETFNKYSNRVIKSVNNYLPIYNNILFSAHGGTIRAISVSINQSLDNIKNTALYYFVPYYKGQNSWKISIL